MHRLHKKEIFKKMLAATVIGSSVLLMACGNSGTADQEGATALDTEAEATAENGTSSEGGVNLTFMIWDGLQQDGMQQMVDKFEEENPNIHVEIQLTPWDQYWTKLDAAATGGDLPDVFWMHPEHVYTYVRGGMLMNVSEKLDGSCLDMNNYPENVVDGFTVDGSVYAVPKDYSTFALAYNKDIFDAAGVAYPDDTWDWSTLKDTAEKLTDKSKNIYGLAVQYNTNDAAYHYIWQNEGDIISEDGSKSMWDDPNTIEAVNYLVDFIEKGYSPTMEDFANTTSDQYFESGNVAMKVAGSWMTTEYDAVDGLNYDVAPLAKGKVRADLCGGMGYSAAANSAHPEEAFKLLEFLGGEEANIIQCESGAAISAYTGTQQSWVDNHSNINAQAFIDAASYGKSSEYCESRNKWVDIENDYMTQVFSLQIPVEEGCKQLAEEMNTILAE